jgi:hypothetical protein
MAGLERKRSHLIRQLPSVSQFKRIIACPTLIKKTDIGSAKATMARPQVSIPTRCFCESFIIANIFNTKMIINLIL